jgi:putative sterol carrier protein
MYVFLSEEWMDAARAIRERYADRLPEVTMSVRLNQIITEVPFGDGTVSAFVDTSEGALVLELGELDDPDAVMMTDYHTARAMIVDQDPTVAMQSFMAGKIRVQGDMMKLMAMQTAMPANEFSEELASEIQAITADFADHIDDAEDFELPETGESGEPAGHDDDE